MNQRTSIACRMQLIEIYRSPVLAACEQRAFVLQAVGIPFEIVAHNDTFSLWVATEAAANAQHHIERYQAENLSRPVKPTLNLHADAGIAPALYVVLLIGVAYFAGQATGNFDWYRAGALLPSGRLHGEWWRTLTALTLHADQAHLLGNIGFGIYFIYLAARLLGWGVAFASTALAAALGNALDSLLMPASHTSIGASTMVFAALGLIAAYSWRRQFDRRLRWTHRWAPLLVGVMLLGLIGSGVPGTEEAARSTDVLAHLTGFGCGALLGAAHGTTRAQIFDRLKIQIAAAVIASATFVGAWFLAFSRV